MDILDELKFDQAGLIPAIVQDVESNEVLMVAFMNRQALQRTIESGRACFWSRSRQEYWVKGETSGHTQTVKSVAIDCDGDALLIKVEQRGGAWPRRLSLLFLSGSFLRWQLQPHRRREGF